MEKIVIVISFLSVVNLVHSKAVYYYPEYAGPDVIVFPGPTNYKKIHGYAIYRDEKENEIADDDWADKLDLRTGEDEIPKSEEKEDDTEPPAVMEQDDTEHQEVTKQDRELPVVVNRSGGFVFPAD